jgi:erythromycin esterase-like protein
MVETAEALARHLESVGERPKIVIWAHNSHLGDAREVFSIGFTTDTGTVTAVSEWNGPAERKRVRSALPGSYETRRSCLAAFKRPSDSARRPFRRPWTGWCPSKGDGNGA